MKKNNDIFLDMFDFQNPSYDFDRFCTKFESIINYQREDLFRKVFKFFDYDKDGRISEKDMLRVMKRMQYMDPVLSEKWSADFMTIQFYL